MASLKLRDRDGIVTGEGLIFRVFGYSHPLNAFICDAEYASSDIFVSNDPRAPRTGVDKLFYKFYDDEGLKLVFGHYPKYTMRHEMLGQQVVGVCDKSIGEVRKPGDRLKVLMSEAPRDGLLNAMQRVMDVSLRRSGLSEADFGVFGSMLHGFYNPRFSDIDLVVYGTRENRKIRETMETLYDDESSGFKNEFADPMVMEGKRWRFKNFTTREFVWHQKRKQIYGLFEDKKTGRTIKAEFEPVKAWDEITSEYDPRVRIVQKDWVKLKARITSDDGAPFIPSVYGIQPLEVLSGGKKSLDATRIVSYMEEFRLQGRTDEIVIVEGALEEVISNNGSFYQIALTYCSRYYDQVLKVENSLA